MYVIEWNIEICSCYKDNDNLYSNLYSNMWSAQWSIQKSELVVASLIC